MTLLIVTHLRFADSEFMRCLEEITDSIDPFLDTLTTEDLKI